MRYDATQAITNSSLDEENEKKNNSDLTVQIQTVTALIHPAPKQSEPSPSKISTVALKTNNNVPLITDLSISTMQSEPSPSKISNRTSNFTASKINYDEITVYYDDSLTPKTNNNVPFTDLSISTLNLSGSFLDVGSIVSLDDILILPLDFTILPFYTLSISHVQKTTPTKEQIPELPSTPSINRASVGSLPVIKDLVDGTTPDPFKKHLMLPKISNQSRKINQRIPAGISSAAWRKFYDDKEEAKNEKQEGIRKRKLEGKEKQEMKKK